MGADLFGGSEVDGCRGVCRPIPECRWFSGALGAECRSSTCSGCCGDQVWITAGVVHVRLPVAWSGIELGDQFSVGGASGVQVLVAFLELKAEVDDLLLKVSDLLL